MDCIVHGVAKSRTRLSDFHFHSCFTMFYQFLQDESAMHVHVSPVVWTSFLFRSPQCIKQSPLCYTVCSHQLSVLYTVSTVYMHQSQSPNSSPSCYPYICSIHLCLFLLCKQDHLYHSSRFHIHVLIYNTCVSLSDLLYSVRQTLGLSTSLKMTQFYSFLWLSNSPLCICITSSLSIPLLLDIQVASMSW